MSRGNSKQALKDQVLLYSLETKSVFTDKEKAISDNIDAMSREKNLIRKELTIVSKANNGELTRAKFETQYRALYNIKKCEPIYEASEYSARIKEIGDRRKEINKLIPELKESLRRSFAENTELRSVRDDAVVDGNIISVFESVLTRTLDMRTGNLYKDIVVVRAFYYDVLKDIMINGFMWEGHKYIFFAASAGQIRTKKVVFVREDIWYKYQPTIMCGLSVEDINELGGVNPNKFIAYLALANSATAPWEDFNIMKSIVIDDFETDVFGLVDFVDEKTYTTERKWMNVPITHTDGFGMIRKGKKDKMCRLPWVKGLLGVFPFDKFILEANEKDPGVNHGLIKDIYGKEHDVIAEDIEVIFTKSQFKMWKYYKSWEDYQKKFITLDCMAGICNEEEDYIPEAKINYQMLQTLNKMTYEEMEEIAKTTNERIKGIASSRQAMLRVFGATKYNSSQNAFQMCLSLYPELLEDEYCRNTLKQIKARLVKHGRAGKLEIQGKYLFLLPDVYAACQHWFLHEDNPEGLLKDGEVSCQEYEGFDELDCLRSPHLYREHAVRKNVVTEEMKRWYPSKAIVTSCHDLISKILMFDNDGDKGLIVAMKKFVEIAKRHCEGIVPLYYNMAKAGSSIITNEVLYNGMIAAYTGGKIGTVSNNITKIWNSDEVDLDIIRILCMENNFVIK